MQKKLWETHWFVIGLVAVAVLLFARSASYQSATDSLYQAYRSQFPATARGDTVVISIDDASIRALGPWPWPQSRYAQLFDILEPTRPRLLASSLDLSAAPPSPAFNTLDALIQEYDASTLVNSFFCDSPDAGQLNEEVSRLGRALHQARAQLDQGAQLLASLRRNAAVYLPLRFSNDGGPPKLSDAERSLLRDNELSHLREDRSGRFQIPQSTNLEPLNSELLAAAQGLGALLDRPREDAAQPLLISFQDRVYPGLSLRLALAALQLKRDDVRMHSNGLWLGGQYIPTDAQLCLRPRRYPSGGEELPHYALHDVLEGRVLPTLFSDKIVLLGFSASQQTVSAEARAAAELIPLQQLSDELHSLLYAEPLRAPAWGKWLSGSLFVLVLFYAAWALPRRRAWRWTLGLSLAFPILQSGLFLRGDWVNLSLPLLLLLSLQLLYSAQQAWLHRRARQRYSAEAVEANRLLGLAYQSQGRLEDAFARFLHCPLDEEILGLLYNLALDFERKRQNKQAVAVYRHMIAQDPDYRDIEQRALRLQQQLRKPRLQARDGGNWLDDNLVYQKPLLGRYQVEKKLGKGAMGMVYLGTDPKMDRVVALKTLALSEEFEGEELAEATERFFREASAAGRLSHPHIISVYDAGEEHNLAYIAMEFFKGGNLVPFTHKNNLLPVITVLELGIHAAEALAYAHSQNVIHRDIKPANILYNPATNQLKLTDFGIARISDNNKTKTGVILGTPSYMSPEQLDGRWVDGGSDLFSLGVTLYQLLTGELPFQADSMASLMFQIAHEAHPDICERRPELPPCLLLIIDCLLSKERHNRYTDGLELAQALRECQLRMPSEAEPAPAPHEKDDES